MKPLFYRIDPSFFHGTAVAACVGLALGLALHGPWQDDRHGRGPRLLVASAAAAELARPADDAEIVQASAPSEETAAYAETAPELTYADTSQLPPDPLPVTRLTGRGGAPIPASVEVERVSDDTEQADGATTVGEFKNDDAPAAAPRIATYTPASYAQTADGR